MALAGQMFFKVRIVDQPAISNHRMSNFNGFSVSLLRLVGEMPRIDAMRHWARELPPGDTGRKIQVDS